MSGELPLFAAFPTCTALGYVLSISYASCASRHGSLIRAPAIRHRVCSERRRLSHPFSSREPPHVALDPEQVALQTPASFSVENPPFPAASRGTGTTQLPFDPNAGAGAPRLWLRSGGIRRQRANDCHR